jgi:hypothetical protein
MTVGELIAELQKHDATARVVVDGYEHGYSDVFDVVDTEVELRGNSADDWWCGLHREVDSGGCFEGQIVPAVYLPRCGATENARRLAEQGKEQV